MVIFMATHHYSTFPLCIGDWKSSLTIFEWQLTPVTILFPERDGIVDTEVVVWQHVLGIGVPGAVLGGWVTENI